MKQLHTGQKAQVMVLVDAKTKVLTVFSTNFRTFICHSALYAQFMTSQRVVYAEATFTEFGNRPGSTIIYDFKTYYRYLSDIQAATEERTGAMAAPKTGCRRHASASAIDRNSAKNNDDNTCVYKQV